MSRRRLLVLAAAAIAVHVPGRSLADEWGYEPQGGYDVSVDLNVQGGVTVEAFHAPLAPHGEWVVVGGYGQVWRPRVAAGWRPYYHGRWEWTNEGWFWASDEPWGWAVYHYGRWAYDPHLGWIWVPGTEWAPAWVAWRASGDVVGWAPLAPGFSVYVGSYPYVDLWWTFVPCGRFVSVPVHQVAYPPGHGRRWFDASAPAPARPRRGGARGDGPAPAWGGPAPRMIEARIGRPVAPARIVRAPAPGVGHVRPGEVAVFRPERPGRDDGHARPGAGERGERGPAVGGRGPAAAPSPPASQRPAPGREGGGDQRRGWRPDHRGGTPQGGGWDERSPRGGAPGGSWRGPAEPRGERGGGAPGAGPRGGGPQGDAPRGGTQPGPHRGGGGSQESRGGGVHRPDR